MEIKAPVNFDVLEKYSLIELINYILPTYHEFSRKIFIEMGIQLKDCQNSQLKNHFLRFSEDFKNHLFKEENILFPFIEFISRKKENPDYVPKQMFPPSVKFPVRMMLQEHESHSLEIDSFLNIIINDPGDFAGKAEFTALLYEFIENLKNHIYVENILLFPKAIFAETN